MIRALYISPGHNFVGHHGLPPGEHPAIAVPQIECVAGRGVKGDRYFDFKPDYKGQITFVDWDVLLQLWDNLGVKDRDPSATRRNVIAQDLDLNSLIGIEFEIQGIRFVGTEECKPCYWMNRAIHPDAENSLRGRGGLRAKILTDGILRVDKPLDVK